MVSGVVAIIGVIEKIYSLPGEWKLKFPEGIVSTLGNPNTLGGYLACFLPLCLSKVLKRKIYLVISLAMILALFFSKSEGAFLALFVGFWISWLTISKKKKKPFLIGISFILLLFLYFLHHLPPISYWWRIFHWRVGWRMFCEKPLFGWGLGKTLFIYPLYQKEIRNSFPHPPPIIRERYLHNDYLQILVETGILGCCLWMAVIAGLFYSIKINKKNFLELVSLSTWMALGIISFPVYNPSLTFPLLLYFTSSFKERKVKLKKWCLPFIILSILFSLSALRICKVLFSQYYYLKGIHLLEKNEKELGESLLLKSIKINPSSPYPYHALYILNKERHNNEKARFFKKEAEKRGIFYQKE